MARFKNGRAFRSDEWVSEGVPIIRIQNLNGGATFNYFDGAFDDEIAVQPGDLLFSWSGNRGTSFGSYRWEGPAGVLNQHIFKVTPASGVDSSFLMHALNYATDRLEGRAHGASGLVHVKKSELTKFEVMVPDSVEAQSAIAGLLEKVTSLQRRLFETVTAKRAFKRALMNDLLTGRRRFPEFEDTGEWVKAPIGALFDVVSRPVEWSDEAHYRLVSIRRRNGGFFDRGTKIGASIKTKGLFAISAGDFVVSRMQAVHGAMATVPEAFHGAHVSGMYLVLVPRDPDHISSRFLDYASSLPYMYRNVLTSCHGVHIEKMTFDPKRYLKKAIWLPPTLQEQERIRKILDSAEVEIRSLEYLVEATSSLKRGLMQRLLSGEIELPEHLAAATGAAGGTDDDS